MPHSIEAPPPTAASQEYLVMLRNLISSGRRATITGLARLLHVTPQAASEMVHRLVAEGLAEQGDGRELTLTGRGRTIADAMFRRHALVEWLLIEVIGMGWAESDEEAQRLQGAISEHVGASLDEFLGHPETCPHGNPIDAAAALRRPAGVTLNSLASGARATIYRITEEAEEDAALLSYLEARGLRPGAAIAVQSSSEALDTISLEGPRGAATLGFRPAALVRVLPGNADPALFHHIPMRSAHGEAR